MSGIPHNCMRSPPTHYTCTTTSTVCLFTIIFKVLMEIRNWVEEIFQISQVENTFCKDYACTYILYITCVTIQHVTFRLVLANSDRLTSLLPLSLINELFYHSEFWTRKKTWKQVSLITNSMIRDVNGFPTPLWSLHKSHLPCPMSTRRLTTNKYACVPVWLWAPPPPPPPVSFILM